MKLKTAWLLLCAHVLVSMMVFVGGERPEGAPPLLLVLDRILTFPAGYLDSQGYLPFVTPLLLLLLIDAAVFVLFVWFVVVLIRHVRQWRSEFSKGSKDPQS